MFFINKISKLITERIKPSINYIKLLRYSSSAVEEEETVYNDLVKRYFHIPSMGHQVLVIQPYIKWGPEKKQNTTFKLQLDEAVSLIRSISDWRVVDQLAVPVDHFSKKTIFGSGNLNKLRDIVVLNTHITAVFINISMLKGFQRREFEELFKVPVYDTYTTVIQIFKQHAESSESKLQVSLAELPYLRSMINTVNLPNNNNQSKLRGVGESNTETMKRVLLGIEMKLKNKLKKVAEQRNISGKKREKLNIPTVAVVGYTNSGKTSLIKSLTGDKNLEGKDVLFATLDVTRHLGMLPLSKLKVLYIDTVGFMSDLPTTLMDCFLATLQCISTAEIILHVCDLSHPDVLFQTENVINTLKKLNPSGEIILVANKCDKEKLYSIESLNINPIKISATNFTGLAQLEEKIEELLINKTDRQIIIIKVPSGGPESSWLYKETSVIECWPDEKNPQYMNMKVTITKVQIEKFKRLFLSKIKKNEQHQ